MAEYEGEPERIWDEYEWERFLQQQDGKTEKYMQLLETYLDDPDRDEIIAREMGWTQLLDANDWNAEVDALLDEGVGDDEGAAPRMPAGPQRSSKSMTCIALRSRSPFGLINCSIKMLRSRTNRQR